MAEGEFPDSRKPGNRAERSTQASEGTPGGTELSDARAGHGVLGFGAGGGEVGLLPNPAMRQEAATTGSLTTKILSLSITPMAAAPAPRWIPLPSSLVAVVVAGHTTRADSGL
jgi:hypothetical protein